MIAWLRRRRTEPVALFADPVILPFRKVGVWDRVRHRIDAHRPVCVVCGAGVFREPVQLTLVQFVGLPRPAHVCRRCLLDRLCPVIRIPAPQGPYR